jgi:hypothetical protein
MNATYSGSGRAAAVYEPGDWRESPARVTSAHPGGREARCHLKQSLGAVDLTLSRADLAQIDHIMAAAVPVGGPTPEGMA